MNEIEEIKSRLNITDVIGEYLELKRAGNSFTALCPFHNEKSPSFSVSPEKGIFKCFDCKESRDIFSFVQKYESIDFPTALRKLANKAGVEIKNSSNSGKIKTAEERKKALKEKEKYFHILEEITTFWQKNLLQNELAKNYLKKRGVDEKMVRKFRLGFAPDSWQDSLNFLKNRNFLEEDIEKVGLIKKNLEKKNSQFYDRFRNRIIFPIFNEEDKVIAFSGRDLSNQIKIAKYLNSPETPFFNKSEVLYGFNFAKIPARKRKYFIITEGQMDLIMSHQIGFENTIATSGTSLTEQHLKLLKRFSDNLIFAFDSDNAGIEAAFRGIQKALAQNFDVKILNLEKDKDPADLILENEKKWIHLIATSQNFILFYIKKILLKNNNIKEKIKEMEEKILPFILEINNLIEKGNYISKISQGFEIQEKYILEALEKFKFDKIKAQDKILRKQIKTEVIKKNKKLDILSKSAIINQIKKKILKVLAAIYFWQQGIHKINRSSQWINEKEVLKIIKQSYSNEIFNKIINLNQKNKDKLIFNIEHFYFNKTKENFLYDFKALQENLNNIILKEKIENEKNNLFNLDPNASEKEKKRILKKIQNLNKKL